MRSEKAEWIHEAVDYLNQVIKEPSKFEMPSWTKLQELTSKGRATLWRNKAIYNKYLEAREVKSKWVQKTGRISSGHRRTLEQRILLLEHQLEEANRIIDSHVRNYILICRNLDRMNVDPSTVMGSKKIDELIAGDDIELRSPLIKRSN